LKKAHLTCCIEKSPLDVITRQLKNTFEICYYHITAEDAIQGVRLQRDYFHRFNSRLSARLLVWLFFVVRMTRFYLFVQLFH